MSVDPRRRPVLFRLAAEGIVPVVGGCAGALAGGVEGGLAGVAVANVVEKAINLFGRGIVERWQAWFAQHSPEQQAEALSELVTLTPAAAREQARELLLELAPHASAADLDLALDYLSAIPGAVDCVLVTDVQSDKKTLPPTVSFDDPESLIRLLPVDLPPYHVPTDLAGTPYRLEELLGAGGFGAVYRASAKTLQHLPFAIKFCLDRGLVASLQKERANLERLMKAANDRGAEHVVRLYGYDLDHATPYLVYEYVPGGDLTRHLAELRHRRGQPLNADEVLDLIRQTAAGLAFAHRHGLVHRDVKPANVLVRDGVLKLADFGLGGVAVTRAVQRSRIGLSTIDYLSLAEQASLFRGAGTPLYMSPEQRRGANPDPRHDLYSLGVMWFQLLIGDVTRELHPGWAKELKVRYAVPPAQIELIERCIGWYEERPKDANELLALMSSPSAPTPVSDALPDPDRFLPQGGTEQDSTRAETLPSASAITPSAVPDDAIRRNQLRVQLQQVKDAHDRIQTEMRTGHRRRWYAYIALGCWVVITALSMMAMDVGSSLTLAIPTAMVIAFCYAVAKAQHDYDLENERVKATRELADEFPDLVEAWGGPKRFANAAFVDATLAQVARPDFRVSGVAAPPAAPEPPPQAIPRTRMPWSWAIAFALPLAVAAGIFAAVQYEQYQLPYTDRSVFDFSHDANGNQTESEVFLDANGNRITRDEYSAAYRLTERIARVGGLGVGIVVFGAALVVFRRPMRFPRVTVTSAMLGLVFPGILLGAAVWGTYYEHFEPKQAKGGRITMDYQGREVKNGGYYHLAQRDLSLQGVVLAAIPAGLSAIGVMLLGRWVMGRRAREAATRFEYEAVAPDGRIVRDTVAAANADDAMRQLRERGLFITTLTEETPSGERSPVAPATVDEAPDEPSEPGSAGASPSQEPIPPSDRSGLRLSLLRAKTKELADAYDALHYANRQAVFPWVWGGLFLGTLVGWIVGEFDYRPHDGSGPFPAAFRGQFEPTSLVLGLVAGTAVWLVVILVGWVWRTMRRNFAIIHVGALVVDFDREFPGLVAAWGGRSVLEAEDTALAICRAVARGDDPAEVPARTLAQIEDDLEVKHRLVRQLTRYLFASGEDESAIRFALGLFIGSWFFAPVLGFVVAMGVSGLFMLSQETKHNTPLVVAVAVPAGLGVAVTIIWLLWRRSVRIADDVMRARQALQSDLEREYGPAFRTLGGLDLNDRRSVQMLMIRFGSPEESIHHEPIEDASIPTPSLLATDPSTEPMRQEVLIGRLKEHYKLLEARDEPPEIVPTFFTWVGPFVGLTIGGILFAAGVETNDIGGYFSAAFFLGGGTIGGSLWLGLYLGRKARDDRQVRIHESTTSLERDYAAQLTEWGGAGLLKYKEAVGGVIRKLGGDPDW